MANIPTVQELYDNISNDLKNKLDINEDSLRKVLDAFTASFAAQFKLIYLQISDVQNEIYPDTANTAANGGTLERHGNIHLGRNIKPASAGVYTATVTGQIGSVLRANLTFKSNEASTSPNNLYILDSQTIISSSPQDIQIRSLKGGSEFALSVNDTLTITEPVIGVDQIITVSAITTAPLSAESVSSYRTAILNSIQLEPQGGALTDYRLWASDAQGVRTVYPFLKDTDAGTIQVYVEATEDNGVNGVPGPTLITSVNEVLQFDPDITKPLNERGRRPVQANLEVLPVVALPVDIIITNLQENTSDIRTLITNSVNTFLRDVRPFIAGADLARNQNDILYSARLQAVVTNVLTTSNFFTNFVMQVNGVTQQSFSFSRQNIPYLRNLTVN